MVLAAAGARLEWHAHLDVWFLIAALLGGYFLSLRVLAPTYAPAGRPAATRSQKLLWVTGVMVLWIGADWPVHELSEDYLFSVHMVQHTLFSLVAPPLLLLGVPAWLARTALDRMRLTRAMRLLTRPLFGLVMFNAVIVLTHWPALVNLSVTNELAHLALHTLLLTVATLMWWPVVSPVPELARLSEPGKMLYLFLQSIIPTVPASFLTFSDKVLYTAYLDAPRITGMSALTDQMVAGLVMKLGGGFLLWFAIAIIFFRWNAREEAGRIEEVPWEQFERELEAWDLRK
ncbi:MAG: cytochrome c oxidase assembly protein [Actinomycetota bacterium]